MREFLSVAVVVVGGAALVLLAGCVAAPAGDALEGSGGLDGATAGASDGAGDEASRNLSARASPVTVVEVTDGDTVDVRYRNGTTETVRLLGVDTPEVHVATDPAEFGVPDTAAGRRCLRAWGDRASTAMERMLAGGGTDGSGGVGLATDVAGDRRGSYGRLLGYLVLPNGSAANALLLRRGLARHYDGGFSRNAEYARLEEAARRADRGLWTCRDPADASTAGTAIGDDTTDGDDGGDGGLAVASIHADAPGDDHEHLAGEYVVFANRGDARRDLAGYTVADEAGHRYRFPEGAVLAAGATVALRTGTGRDGDGDLYWNRSRAVWNNGGDTVTVRDASGDVVARRSY